jgi:hypothetical protein
MDGGEFFEEDVRKPFKSLLGFRNADFFDYNRVLSMPLSFNKQIY